MPRIDGYYQETWGALKCVVNNVRLGINAQRSVWMRGYPVQNCTNGAALTRETWSEACSVQRLGVYAYDKQRNKKSDYG